MANGQRLQLYGGKHNRAAHNTLMVEGKKFPITSCHQATNQRPQCKLTSIRNGLCELGTLRATNFAYLNVPSTNTTSPFSRSAFWLWRPRSESPGQWFQKQPRMTCSDPRFERINSY